MSRTTTTDPDTPTGLERIPAGITVVEASAGTGKTHRVTTEAVREVAAGTPLHEMLLVTFTIAATSELRSRVWDRLRQAVDALGTHLAGEDVDPGDDDLLVELLDGSPEDLRRRHSRLATAATSFDAATITTIHGFCLQVLQALGFAADAERAPRLVEDLRDLRDEVVDDLLVRKLRTGAGVTFARAPAARIAERVTVNPTAPVVPVVAGDADNRSADVLRVRFAEAVRDNLDRRKREAGVLGYDDLLLRVRDALVHDVDGSVRRRLRRRFSLVVVDEFQDTDAVQWDILRAAFAEPPTRLVLVGDPKQAIYAFRGADVHAYLAARHEAGDSHISHLGTSWRADAGLLRALDALFADTALGHEEIRYASVAAAPGRDAPSLHGLPRPAPLRVRITETGRFPPEHVTERAQVVQKDAAIDFVAADLAADIVEVLRRSPSRVDSPTGEEVPLRAGDIAVLVGRNQDATTVRDALVAVGVPAVVNGAGSVFDTPAARCWLALLDAVEHPASTGAVRNAALSSLLGWTVARLDGASDDEWDRLHERLHEWRRHLASGNLAALFDRVASHSDLAGRLLSVEGGERELTDLRHLAALLHAQAAHGGGAPALLAWLRERMREADREAGLDDRNRRLETDDHAVQVWTIHRSKGLEYPMVYVPYLWTPPMARADDVLVYHDPERGERVIDVSDPDGEHASEREDHKDRYLAEEAGGLLRLAYVALTRARSQVVLWWVRGHRCHRSPLGRLLLGDARTSEPDDDEVRHAADVMALRAGTPDGAAACVSVEIASGPTGARWTPPRDPVGTLEAARFDRRIDRAWRRTSYSALTSAAHDSPDAHGGPDGGDEDAADGPGDRADAGVAPEHDERGLDDERMPDDLASDGTDDREAADEERLRGVASPFGELGGGARFGTLVHSVLEVTDFATDDLRGDLTAVLASQHLGAHAELDLDALVEGLVAAVETPLGPLVGGARLRDIDRADRLDELHFELPLVGGDDPHATLTTEAIADVVEATLPAQDPFAGYHERLRSPAMATEVRGHLSGAIDVVVRRDGRYFVIDHKSNWLGVPGEELSAWHYRPSALRAAMVRAHYPLQAMLYGVALHRYLRWRLPDHDPGRDLGGILYLFLRGMTGSEVPLVGGQPCGVMAWKPPVELITGLSEVLDRGAAPPGPTP